MKVINLNPIIDVTFWQRAYYLKLDELKLSEEEIELSAKAKYSKFNQNEVRINFDVLSYEKNSKVKINYNSFYDIKIKGAMKIINMGNSFDKYNKNIQTHISDYLKKSDEKIYFYILLFIDHKKFTFKYIFYQLKYNENYQSLIKKISKIEEIEVDISEDKIEETNGFVVQEDPLVLCDTSNGNNVSKLILDYVALNYKDKKSFYLNKTNLILREDSKKLKLKALNFTINENKNLNEKIKTKKIMNTQINLKSFLSKDKIIEDQSKLNLKLMKWRLEPKLDLNLLSTKKFFILGTGTLGCNLARLLIGYGVKYITFLDYGHVSYSNLARQSLFTTDNFDSEDKGITKVEAAKINLLKIAPHTIIETIFIKVPMPGHFVTESAIESTFADLLKVEELIKNHDILLNCFDSREARYFPSLIGALYNKLCLSIGIGYDSFVIVRHGKYGPNFYKNIKEGKITDEKEKENIGCFFCSDYLPPSDSMSNRTLDQQCTVSRPGISMISCGVGIEMLINALHDNKIGKSPHFCRGTFGSNYEFVTYENTRYDNCTACSQNVISEYVKDKKKFMIDVLNSPGVLNIYSGFNETLNEVDEDDLDSIIIIESSFMTAKKK